MAKPLFAPTEYDVKTHVDWFIDQFSKSAFVDDDDLKGCLANMFECAILNAKNVECRRIEKLLYEKPELVEENRKLMELTRKVI